MARVTPQQKEEAANILQAATKPETAATLTQRQVINAIRVTLRGGEESYPIARHLDPTGLVARETPAEFARKGLKGAFPALAKFIDHAAAENACEDIINEINNQQ